MNILRIFLLVWGDDGVDRSVQDLAKMPHEHLVDLCVQTQRDRKRAINKPWVQTVPEVWEVRGDLDVPGIWDVGTRDLRALGELRKKEDALVRKTRGRSLSPRQAKNRAKLVPRQDNQWEADDLQPLTLRGRGGKGMEKAEETSKTGAKSDDHCGGKDGQQAQGDGKGHKKELANLRKELQQLKSDRAGDGKDVKKKSRSRSRRSRGGSWSRSPSSRRSRHQSRGQSSNTASNQSRSGSRGSRGRRRS